MFYLYIYSMYLNITYIQTNTVLFHFTIKYQSECKSFKISTNCKSLTDSTLKLCVACTKATAKTCLQVRDVSDCNT